MKSDGEVIDLTSKQYSLNSLPIPSIGRSARLKEQGRQMSFPSYKKRVEELMEITWYLRVFSPRKLFFER